MSPEQKAVAQVLEMIEASYKPRDQRDLAAWLVSSMRPEVVDGLAADFDEAQGELREVEQEGGDE